MHDYYINIGNLIAVIRSGRSICPKWVWCGYVAIN